MLKKRLVFTLLYDDGEYQLSRNFRLQQVGDLKWLRDNYDFDSIAYSIDELVVLNVSREQNCMATFANNLMELSNRYFLPVTAGGRVRSLDDAILLLRSNADKIIINQLIFENPSLVRLMSSTLGAQCIVASIDCRAVFEGFRVFTDNGRHDTGYTPSQAVDLAQDLGVGEIYLTSIDRDGTGNGYDVSLYESVREICRTPIILSGGVGKSEHLLQGLKIEGVSGASTANIFNFMSDGLKVAREYLKDTGIHMATWDKFEKLKGNKFNVDK